MGPGIAVIHKTRRISFNSRITGIPLVAGSVDLTFQVTDALGGTAQKTLTLTIRQ